MTDLDDLTTFLVKNRVDLPIFGGDAEAAHADSAARAAAYLNAGAWSDAEVFQLAHMTIRERVRTSQERYGTNLWSTALADARRRRR